MYLAYMPKPKIIFKKECGNFNLNNKFWFLFMAGIVAKIERQRSSNPL